MIRSESIMSSSSTSSNRRCVQINHDQSVSKIKSARANEIRDLLGIPAPGSFDYNNIIYDCKNRSSLTYKEHYFSAWLRQEAKLVQKETDHHHHQRHINNFHLSTHEPMLRKIGDPELLPPAAASPPLADPRSSTRNCDKYSDDMISTDDNKHNDRKLLQDPNSVDPPQQYTAAAAGPSMTFIPSSLELLKDNHDSSTKMQTPISDEYDNQDNASTASTAPQTIHVGNVVVVVVDASAIISSSSSSTYLSSTDHLLNAPTYALHKLQLHPGDALHFLGVLAEPSFRISSQLLGYKIRINAGAIFGVKKGKGLKKRKQIETKLQSFYRDCIEKGVKLYLDVKQGKPKIVATEHARALKATHLVLDRGIKITEKHFCNLNACKIIQVPCSTSSTTLQGKQEIDSEYVCVDMVASNSEISPETLSTTDSMENLLINDEIFTIEIATSTRVESDIQAFVYKKEDTSKLKHNTAEQLATQEETNSTASKRDTESDPCNELASFVERSDSMLGVPPQSWDPSRFPLWISPAEKNNKKHPAGPVEFDGRYIPYSHISNSNQGLAGADLSSFPHIVEDIPRALNAGDLSCDQLFLSDYPLGYTNNFRVISVQPHRPYDLQAIQSLLQEHFSPEKHYSIEYSLEGELHPPQPGADMDKVVASWNVSQLHVNEKNYSTDMQLKRIHSDIFLCSVCKQASPDLGKQPRRFSYEEIQLATTNFSDKNFLGEEKLGSVYKGCLREGQVIAVKQIKRFTEQDKEEYYMEIELLSCVQHRNLVILLGYCDEEDHPMLVYEHVCNRSLAWHFSREKNPNGLEWWARQKIALGAARALRYLHEECRQGCIVHRDVKPENIFLTHNFEPMVGNFGLARPQESKDGSLKTSAGANRSMESECANQDISWRSDIYAFGVILLQLITGKTVIEHGQRNIVDWARPLLDERKYHELLDPRLENSHDSFELVCMVRVASLCLQGHQCLEEFPSRTWLSRAHPLQLMNQRSRNKPPEDGKEQTRPSHTGKCSKP